MSSVIKPPLQIIVTIFNRKIFWKVCTFFAHRILSPIVKLWIQIFTKLWTNWFNWLKISCQFRIIINSELGVGFGERDILDAFFQDLVNIFILSAFRGAQFLTFRKALILKHLWEGSQRDNLLTYLLSDLLMTSKNEFSSSRI